MNRFGLLSASQAALWAMSAALTTLAFKSADPDLPTMRVLAMAAAAYAVAAALAPLVGPVADEVALALARLRVGGLLFVAYSFILLLFIYAMTTGKSDVMLYLAKICSLVQVLHLLLGSDERRQGRTLLSALALAATATLTGGPWAMLAVVVYAAGYPVVLILLNHAARWQHYRARGSASGINVTLLASLYAVLMLGITLAFFQLAPDPRPAEHRTIRIEHRPPPKFAVDVLWLVLGLAALVVIVVLLIYWGRKLRRGSKTQASPDVADAVPVKIEPIAPAYAPPPIEGGPRRQIVARFIRLLSTLGLRRRDQTAREFAPPAWEEALTLFGGARYGVTNDVGEREAARLAELEAELTRQKKA